MKIILVIENQNSKILMKIKTLTSNPKINKIESKIKYKISDLFLINQSNNKKILIIKKKLVNL